MQAMHVVVTGVGGFVGEEVARACLGKGWRVTALYRNRPPLRIRPHPMLSVVATDLRQCNGLPKRYDYLVHCAAEVPATQPDADELFSNNVQATRRILEHAAEADARNVVYMSSMAVYGAISVAVVDEATAPTAATIYGRSKAEGERLLGEWAARKDRGGIAIRLPGVVGSGGRNNFLCDTLARILADKAVTARNPEALFNNVVHVKDLARFVVELLPRITQGVVPLTLGAAEPLRIRQILSRLFQGVGKTPRVDWQDGGSMPFLISFERALTLGYKPATVANSIDRFVADVLKDQFAL